MCRLQARINTQRRSEEAELEEEVAAHADDGQHAELLDQRDERQDADGEDGDLEEQVLGDVPPLSAQPLRDSDARVQIAGRVRDRFSDNHDILKADDDHEIRKNLPTVERLLKTVMDKNPGRHHQRRKHRHQRADGHRQLGLHRLHLPDGEVDVNEEDDVDEGDRQELVDAGACRVEDVDVLGGEVGVLGGVERVEVQKATTETRQQSAKKGHEVRPSFLCGAELELFLLKPWIFGPSSCVYLKKEMSVQVCLI